MALVQGCDPAIKARADLSETAKSYMDLRQRGQWERVWDEYVDPALRNKEKRKVYMAKRRSVFDIEAFEVVSVAEKGTKGEVVVEIDAIVPVLKPGGGILRLPREPLRRLLRGPLRRPLPRPLRRPLRCLQP